MSSGSAIQRRRQQNSAVVAAHPRWHGIRHPELLTLPPTRFSRLHMLPAVERGRGGFARPPVNGRPAWERRTEQNQAIIAAHLRWKGIRHPERLFLTNPLDEDSARLGYRRAVSRALVRLRESEHLCSRIDTVAGDLGRRRWSWSTSPQAAPPSPPADPPAPKVAPTAARSSRSGTRRTRRSATIPAAVH